MRDLIFNRIHSITYIAYVCFLVYTNTREVTYMCVCVCVCVCACVSVCVSKLLTYQ